MGGASFDYGQSIKTDALGNIYLAGEFMGTSDFDPGINIVNLTPVALDDVFIVKLCPLAAPTVTFSGSTTICIGGSVTLTSSSATSYSWNNGATTQSTTVSSSGNYSVIVTNTNGCSAYSSPLAVNVTTPVITVNNGTICAGGTFTMVPTGASTYTYSSGTAIVSPTANTTYSVIGTTTAGCVSPNPGISNVTVNPKPIINPSSTSSVLCVGQTATLSATGSVAPPYNWIPPSVWSASITITPSVTTTYSVSNFTAAGCWNTVVFTQSVSACTGINQSILASYDLNIFPNPFNNKITIINKGVDEHIEIINTLGSLIYSAEIKNETTEIDLNNQASGIYFVRIGTATKKIIKE